MKHLISLRTITKKQILELLSVAAKLKADRASGRFSDLLRQKTLIMLFEKTSTRTRLSYEAAMTELGGHAVFLDQRTTQFALTEFDDEIQAVMRFGHVLMYRAKQAKSVEIAASHNQIPVIDGCSEKYHPSQALSDLLTMAEHSGGIENVHRVVWMGIENNVSNTLMLACVKLGIEFVLLTADVDEDSIDHELIEQANSTGLVKKMSNVKEVLATADYVHTDTWMNMEFFENGVVRPEYRQEYERRMKAFESYRLTGELIDEYAPQAKIMHCMPCHVGYEISRSAIDHTNAIILDQAENRLHMQKAMLVWLVK